MPTSKDHVYYLYCLTLPPVAPVLARGVNGGKYVFLHVLNGVVAVVSEIPTPPRRSEFRSFTEMLGATGGKWSERHQEVVSEVGRRAEVAPVLCGMTFSSIESLNGYLLKNRAAILRKLNGETVKQMVSEAFTESRFKAYA